ncbi:MAG: hypothetical protein ABI852_01705 [Gemmatimonadaceae bacterium]
MLPQPRPSLTNVYLIDSVGAMAAVLYAIANRPAPPLVGIFLALAPVVAVGLWFQKFLRHAHFALPYDFGYFFMIGWPVLIPVFVRRLPTPNPWRLAAMLYVLALAPALAAFTVEVVMYAMS